MPAPATAPKARKAKTPKPAKSTTPRAARTVDPEIARIKAEAKAAVKQHRLNQASEKVLGAIIDKLGKLNAACLSELQATIASRITPNA